MTATTDGSTGALPPSHRGQRRPQHRDARGSRRHRGRPPQRAVQRATAICSPARTPQGWWKGDLETNVTMDAEDLLLRQFLGIRDEPTTRRRRPLHPRPSSARTAPGPPSTAAPATSPPPSRRTSPCGSPGTPPTRRTWPRASAWVRDQGGIAAARVFTRIWLALFGWWKWEDLPELPPELIYLPKWFPLNIYDFGCWARQTIVPLTVVSAHRPVRPAPFALDELHTDPRQPNPPRPPRPAGQLGRRSSSGWTGPCTPTARSPPRPLRRAALSSARPLDHRAAGERRLLGRHPAARRLLRHRPAPARLRPRPPGDARRAGVAGPLRRRGARTAPRMIEACQSPVWDTCLATIALADAGLPADHPALVKAADWMLAEQITRPGDWSVQRPRLAPGGWAFEFHNDNYPDIDDTAEVVLALRRVDHPDPARVDGGRRARGALEPRHAVQERRLGRLRRRQHQPLPQPAAVLRLRRGHRPAVRRRHRARRRDARRERPARRPAHPARRRLAAGRAGGERRLVRPLGRQLRLRHRLRGARADRRRPAGPTPPSAGPSAGWRASRTRTAAGARTCAPTPTPDGSAAAPPPPPRPPGRCWRSWRPGSGRAGRSSAASHWLAEHPARRTAPGTSRTSPAPASPGTSPSTTTSTGMVFPLTALGRYVQRRAGPSARPEAASPDGPGAPAARRC